MAYVERAGGRLWWDAQGSGEPVLLIMGLGYASDMWYRLLPALQQRYRTIRFDNRGVGRTGVPPGPYSVELLAGDAAAVLAAAGESSAHVVGVSLGGVIAQELAVSRPELVRSLVLACTHPGGRQVAPFSDEAMALLTNRERMTPHEAAEAAVPFVYAASTPRERIEEDLAVRLTHPTDPEGYRHQLLGAIAYRGSYPRLSRITAPTLIVSGSADRLVNPDNARVLAAALPQARVEVLEGASHIFFTDAPERSTQILMGFLDEVSGYRAVS